MIAIATHSYVRGSGSGPTIEPCEVEACCVGPEGRTECGSLACPSCGRGGSNLSITPLLPQPTDGRVRCGCGHSWTTA